MRQYRWRRGASLLLALALVTLVTSGCSRRPLKEEDVESAPPDGENTEVIGEGIPRESASIAWMPDLSTQAQQKAGQNGDTVGWLQLPDTPIDDVVLWHESSNDYYLYKNFSKRYDRNGVFYADFRNRFGEGYASDLSKNTILYGHSMNADRDGVKFGPMRYYLDEEYARSHPYIYFSTTRENLAWEVVAVFYVDYKQVHYDSPNPTDEEFAQIIKQVQAQSVWTYDVDLGDRDKYLTLSTCVYALPERSLEYPNDYRLGILARLVAPGEAQKTTASLTVNQNRVAA